MRKEGSWPALFFVALILVALLGAMALTGLIEQPPSLRLHSGPDQFDAARAKGRLAELLGDQRPHPANSPADDAVRARLATMLGSLGLKPIIRDQFSCNTLVKRRGVSCARVHNIIVPLGMPGANAALLNAHYDSVPAGPGASDDGMGVASLVEIASILKDRPLKRPVILLFNEGEERGLLGARAFLADPLSRNVSSLINLEARGVNGPVNMFETNRPNSEAIRLFAEAVRAPVANSLATDVYRMLPNTTDVNTFSARGWLTFNLAPIGNETRYHSPGDDLAALDPATLQHMGDQALGLTQALANGEQQSSSGDRIFMDIAARELVSIPLWLGAAILVFLLAAFLVLSLRSRNLRRGAPVMIGTFIGSAALAWVGISLISAVRTGMYWRAHPGWPHIAAYSASTLIASMLLAISAKAIAKEELRIVFWLFQLLVGAIIGLIAPGAIIFFIFPPAIALAGIIAGRWWTWARLAGSIGAILFLYISWGGLLGLLGELLAEGPLWLFAPLGSLIVLAVLVEAAPLFRSVGMRASGIVAGLISLVLWTGAATAPAYSEDRQQRFVIEHVTDALHQKSWWSVQNDGASLPSDFPGTWTRGTLPFSESRQWLSPSPADRTSRPPEFHIVSQLREGEVRVIRMRLAANGNDSIFLIAPSDADIRAAGQPGSASPIEPGSSGKFAISCFGLRCDGQVLELRTGKPGPVKLTIIGSRPLDAPGAAGLTGARPAYARPQYNRDESIIFGSAEI